jgi:hypothetical protein
MPIDAQFGFIFSGNGGNNARTIAHELGHGAFNLQHPYDITDSRMQTEDYLMAYSQSTRLYKKDWENVHDPEWTLGWFQKVDDGASVFIKIDNSELSKLFKTKLDFLATHPFFAKIFTPIIKNKSKVIIRLMTEKEKIAATTTKYDNAGNIIETLIDEGTYSGGIRMFFSKDTCYIKLYPDQQSFTTETVFHELFHASQDIYYLLSDCARDETEVRVATLFIAYYSLDVGFRNKPEYVYNRLKSFQIDDYLVEYLVQQQGGNYIFQNDLNIYFDDLINKKPITDDLRKKIKKVSYLLQDYMMNTLNYKFPTSYDGSLKYFESLIN